ncbi:hypothetical protein BDV25DRAFT_138426 [Aspergillus avenaceus]|uniref:Uncharacterized protein n=1 Tax=Aspergillus avenaceus TaxID=36643 RepID=A0A5N6TZR0_ASPAV|nr:hypothetical protein BDV25DRAFT_138426 [Aspergillus avenaceus]
MADATDPSNPPEEPPKQVADITTESHTTELSTHDMHTTDMHTNDLHTNVHSAPTSSGMSDSAFAAMDTSLPPIDKSLPAMDPPVSGVDSSLPPIDSSIPSLPPIDTSLPPIDTTLPAHDDTLDTFSFGDTKTSDLTSEHTTHLPESSSNLGEHSGPSVGSWQSPPNGTHSQPIQPPQHDQSPQPHTQTHYQQQPTQQQQQQHAPSQQYQSQPQQQNHGQQAQSQYQHQTPEMYQNHQGVSSSMSAPSMQTMDHHNVQGQQSHVPQAPIGSPMPPMSSVGQYMTGYPSNVSQMGMNSNAQMRYQLPGDPNKMLMLDMSKTKN